MKKSLFRFLGVLILTLAIFTIYSGAAYAVSVSISCKSTNSPSNFVPDPDNLANAIALGSYVQIIQSNDATIGNPDNSGNPTSDTVITNAKTTIGATVGEFVTTANIASSQYVSIRVWKTWKGPGNGVPTGKYVTSKAEAVGTAFGYVFKPKTNEYAAGTMPVPDVTAPAAISLSAATGTVAGQVILNFNAVGDDGNTGTASKYTIKYSTAVIDNETKWTNATLYAGAVPNPKAAGQAESITLTDLTPGTIYYFAIKAQDEVPNIGPLSNSPSAKAKENPAVPGTLKLSSATYSVNENGTNATITVTRTVGSDGIVGISYATNNGSATAGSDYTATSGTLNWANGNTADQNIIIPITNDTLVENDETVIVNLSVPSGGATVGNPGTATLTIKSEDVAPGAPTITQIMKNDKLTDITNTGEKAAVGIWIYGTKLGPIVKNGNIYTWPKVTFTKKDGTTIPGTIWYPNPNEQEIQVQIPQWAVTGNITVTTQNGTVSKLFTILPPDQITDLKATGGNKLITLNWTDPAADKAAGTLTGVLIVKREGSAPVFNPVQGTKYDLNQNVGNDTIVISDSLITPPSKVDVGENGKTYYYIAFTHDNGSNYSGPSNTVSATPTAPLPDAPTIDKVYNKLHSPESWVYVTPAGGNWKPGDPTDDSLNLIVEGKNFGGTSDGTSEAPNAQSYVQVSAGTIPYTTVPFYWWQKDKIELGIPAKINGKDVEAGQAMLKVFASGVSVSSPFDIKANIYSITPTSAMPNDEVTIAGLAFGDNKDNVQVTFNNLPATIVTLANDSIKVIVPQLPVTNTVEVIVTVNDVSTTYSGATKFIISDKSPKITLVSPASPEVGQTITLTGTNFGAEKGDSVVRFGQSIMANPTKWSDTSITVAVPTEVGTGESDITIVTSNGENIAKLNINSTNIVIDDIDGGCVGSFDPTLAKDSGYYAFGAGITPDEKSISKDGPQTEAMFPVYGVYKGMKIKYSYATGEAAGWGGKLANVLDISKAIGISMLVKWDNSANDFTLVLKDKNGIQAKALVPKSTLQALNNTYAKISISRSNFTPETSGFDWTKIAEYSIVYTTKASSEGVQYFDSIIAYTQGQVIQTEVAITSIDPSSAPAGTKVNVNGQGFGLSQGQSVLVFENVDTKVSYNGEITKWGDTQLEAKVPTQAIGGIYNVRVLKVAILANTLNALESNNASFKVTAPSPADGVVIAYPNPFNPLSNDPIMNKATLVYNPGTATNIGIYIYDMTAKLIFKNTVSTSQTTWDGKDTWSNYASNGAYLVRVVNEDNKSLIAKGKVLVIKE